MISVSNKKWAEKIIDQNLIEKLKQDEDFTDILAKIIISRNFDKEEIYSINNELNFKNIFVKDIDYINSVELLAKIIKKKDKICIIGDYDVDGSASTALFIRFFNHIKQPFSYFIPDREKDGYGASIKIINKVLTDKPKLVIMVDCGSTSNDSVDLLNKHNIKSIIIDHHEINKPYPNSNCIINPKKYNIPNNYDYLCATALSFFFLDLIIKKIGSDFKIRSFLIFVVLATVCDVMPLRKLNRILSIKALNEFDIENFPSFKEIYTQLEKINKISINDIGYLIGPILNSGGRLGHSHYATELLSSNDNNTIIKKSSKLIQLNEKRKVYEDDILKKINFDQIESENKEITIIYNPIMNEGLIGIIAARLKDYFNKPAIVITKSNNVLKGSARSINNFDIGISIKNALDRNIIIKGGGHKMAGGFTLMENNLELLFKHFYKSYAEIDFNYDRDLFIFDSKVSSSAFNKEFYNSISKLEPFGNDNSEPLFLFKSLKILKSKIINEKHISCILKSKNGYSINSISFNSIGNKVGEYLLNFKSEIDVIGQIKENFWNNKNTLQLNVKDLIIQTNKLDK